jgi:hypothetical protein
MFAVLMLLHGISIELAPDKGLVGFLAVTYGIHIELYGAVFFLSAGVAMNKRLLPSQFFLTLVPLIFHMIATWYYSLFVAVNSTLSPAIWITFIVSIGIVSVFKGTYNDLYSVEHIKELD